MERHTKMCVAHLNEAVSFLFFIFVCESCCSTHPPTRRCVCCFYLYLYLYLFVFVFVFVFEVVDMHVMGVAYKGSFWWDLGCVRYWDLLIELVARQSTPWNDDYDYPPPPSPGSYFFSLIIFSSADPNPTLFLFLF